VLGLASLLIVRSSNDCAVRPCARNAEQMFCPLQVRERCVAQFLALHAAGLLPRGINQTIQNLYWCACRPRGGRERTYPCSSAPDSQHWRGWVCFIYMWMLLSCPPYFPLTVWHVVRAAQTSPRDGPSISFRSTSCCCRQRCCRALRLSWPRVRLRGRPTTRLPRRCGTVACALRQIKTLCLPRRCCSAPGAR